MTRAVVGYLAAAMLLTAGCSLLAAWAGLLCAGFCTAALTTLLLLDVGGDQ